MQSHILRAQALLLRNASQHSSLLSSLPQISHYKLAYVAAKKWHDQRRCIQNLAAQTKSPSASAKESQVKDKGVEALLSKLTKGLPQLQSTIPDVKAYATRLHQMIYLEHLHEEREVEKIRREWSDKKLKKEGFLLTGMRGRDDGPEVIHFYRNDELPFHVFKRGALVQFRKESYSSPTFQGIVYRQGKKYLDVVSRRKERNVSQSTWRLELGFSNLSYEKMRDALARLCMCASSTFKDWYDPNVDTSKRLPSPDIIIVQKNANSLANRSSLLLTEHPELKQWVEGKTKLKDNQIHSELSKKQLSAIRKALKHPVYMIQGAPGTGKTRMIAHIVHIVRQLKSKDIKILVCAHSNAAVDRVVEYMEQFGLKATRIGAPGRINPSLRYTTLNGCISEHPDFSKLQKLLKRLKEEGYILDLTDLDEEDYAHDERLKEYFNLRTKIMNDVINKIDVVCATCIGSGYKELQKYDFQLVIIDDASHCTEPETLVPIIGRGKHVIFIGDTKQIQPHVMDENAIKGGLKVSMLQRMIDANIPNSTLTTQYRMHPAIFQFPKEVYYHNQVQTYSSAHTQEIPLLINSKEKVQDVRPSVIFVDLDEGKAKKCDQTNSSGQNSKANISDFVEAAVSLTVALVKQNSYTLLKDIGIVTVCQEQQYHIQKEIDAVFSANNNSTSVKGKSKSKAKSQHQAGPDDLQGPVVETIGGFQGHEKSVIIFIPTFINEKGDIEATRRNGVINVGLTRAKHLLIVVAHGNALKKETRWKKWINWLQNNAPQSNVGTISIEECNAIIDSI